MSCSGTRSKSLKLLKLTLCNFPPIILERIIEDHEVLVNIRDDWASESINRLCLNRSLTKFEILQNPEV